MISQKKAIEQAELACKEMASQVEGEGCEVFVTLPKWVLAKILEMAKAEAARQDLERQMNREPPF